MKFKVMTAIFALALITGAAALTLAPGARVASASPRSGDLHVTKECSAYDGTAGSFCTITSSNIKAIEAGSKVVYASAFGTPTPGVLDSDIVLQVGPGNSAFGHVYLNGSTGTGVVTFSGGTGQFTHFQASADVTSLGARNWAWDGTYNFSPPD